MPTSTRSTRRHRLFALLVSTAALTGLAVPAHAGDTLPHAGANVTGMVVIVLVLLVGGGLLMALRRQGGTTKADDGGGSAAATGGDGGGGGGGD